MTTEEINDLNDRDLDIAVSVALGIRPSQVRIRGTADGFVTIYSKNQFFQDGTCSENELIRYGSPLKYSTDLNAAWLLMDAFKTWLFSQRQKFYGELGRLCQKIGDNHRYVEAWPDAIRNLTPDKICRAFLFAAPERKEQPHA